MTYTYMCGVVEARKKNSRGRWDEFSRGGVLTPEVRFETSRGGVRTPEGRFSTSRGVVHTSRGVVGMG